MEILYTVHCLYSTRVDLNIEFESPACTKICCDSADVQELLGILSEVTKYHYQNEATLILYNQEGKLINLKNF